MKCMNVKLVTHSGPSVDCVLVSVEAPSGDGPEGAMGSNPVRRGVHGNSLAGTQPYLEVHGNWWGTGAISGNKRGENLAILHNTDHTNRRWYSGKAFVCPIGMPGLGSRLNTF